MPQPAVFDTQSGKRIGAIVQNVERAPRNRPQKRGRWPVLPGGTTLVPLEIVQRDDSEGDAPDDPDADDTRKLIVVHRKAPWLWDEDDNTSGIDVRRLNENLEIKPRTQWEHAYADVLTGVLWTGKRVFAVQKFGKLWLENGANFWHTATAIEDISATGGKVRLWGTDDDDDGVDDVDPDIPLGPVVTAYPLFSGSLTEGTRCVVQFDDHEQKFIITIPECPEDDAA